MDLQAAKKRLGQITFTGGEQEALLRAPFRGFNGSDPNRPMACYVKGNDVEESDPANWSVMTDDAIIALAEDMPPLNK